MNNSSISIYNKTVEFVEWLDNEVRFWSISGKIVLFRFIADEMNKRLTILEREQSE